MANDIFLLYFAATQFLKVVYWHKSAWCICLHDILIY